jgi:hypothetical protein
MNDEEDISIFGIQHSDNRQYQYATLASELSMEFRCTSETKEALGIQVR